MPYAAESMRERQLNIRLSEEEAARLERVANHYGLNAAGVLRMLVKRAHDSLPSDAAAVVQLDELEMEIIRVLGARRVQTDLRAALKQAGSSANKEPARALATALTKLLAFGYVEKRGKTHALTPKGRELV